MDIDLQRIQIKILSNAPGGLDLNPFIEIFGRWRGEKSHPAQWVDLADYAHVPRGPGIVLVGFNANFSFDMTADSNGAGESPGTLYFAKKGLLGSYSERILSAMKTCLTLSQRLVAEREFPPAVVLQPGSLEIRFPDRLLTPNSPSVHERLRPALEESLTRLYGAGSYALNAHSNSSEAPSYSVRAESAGSLDDLLRRLG
jgi:hypothetical protein